MSQLISNIQTLLALAQCLGVLKFSNLITQHQLRNRFLSISYSVNWLYVAFCNRIFNFSLVLCLLWNGVGVVRVVCSPGYRLCSVVKCVVSSVLGNSSL